MRTKLTQRQRAVALLIDFSSLMVISAIAFGSVFPPLGDKGFWFYTALLGVLLGAKLVTPFYVKPVDAVSYAVPAFIALMLSNNWTTWAPRAQIAYVVAVTITALTAAVALIAILLNGWDHPRAQDASNRLRLLAEGFAAPSLLYSPILVFSMLAYHYESPKEIAAVSIAMLFTTTFSLGDILITTLKNVRFTILGGQPASLFGVVAAYQKPGIYLLRTNSLDELQLPTPILVRDSLSGSRFAYAVDTVGRENGHLCRAVELSPAGDTTILDFFSQLPPDSSVILDEELITSSHQDTQKLFDAARSITGLVAPDSTVPRLFVEITQNDGIEVGRLLSVEVQGRKVLYQLVAGLTREEAVHQKNTYGYLRAQAQQVGIWKNSKFTQCRWLPEMHAPVRLEVEASYQITERSIGRFPRTNYTAEIGDINQLVTHNTAILGILGVGKTMLAVELVERMLAQGIKVICLDLTNQYEKELTEFYCADAEAANISKIRAACQRDSDTSHDNPEEGGSLPNLRKAIEADLTDFLRKDNPRSLKIYNPADFVATHQEYEPKQFKSGGDWKRSAGLYSVTPVQATQLISEAALRCVSDEMSDTARVCLVYEEAHALVPEWNSIVVEGDRRATSGTARAILQGRKYGLGCLLITQRTANVTKTILNQCNTIFAMRTFDETGKEFLSNYLGRDYSNELSSLPERHAVFFGRGSNCENPVLIRLNDRQTFLSAFRAVNPPPDKENLCQIAAQEFGPQMGSDDTEDSFDDLPF